MLSLLIYLIIAFLILCGIAAFIQIINAIIWFYWPRIEHARLIQDPMQKANVEFSLMRQAAEIEALQIRNAQSRVAVEMAYLKAIGKDEAVFDATQRVLHQNASGQAMLQAPNALTQLTQLDLMTQLDGCDSILIVAKKGAGKSNLLRRIIDKRSGVSVLDPHASPNQWGAHQVVGAGLEFDAISVMLNETTETERRNRYKQLGQGVTQFSQRTFCFDEMTEVTSEIDVAKPVQRLLNCRKVNMKVVMGGHSMNAKDLGLDGKFNLLKNFDAVVKIDYNRATDERHYLLCLQPQGHHDDFVECANPGLYVPTVVPGVVPTIVPVPDQVQSQDSLVPQSPVTADSYLLKVDLAVKDQIYYYLRQVVQDGKPLESIGRNTVKAALKLTTNNNELAEMVREAKERVIKEQQS